MKKDIRLSEHARFDKAHIDASLIEDCLQTGRRELNEEPNKWKARKTYDQGELIVIFRETDEDVFVITTFWNVRKRKSRF